MNAYQKINEMITQRMIDRITETNTLPWKKPWTSVSLMPKDLVTGKNYRGVNVFLLHMKGVTYILMFLRYLPLAVSLQGNEVQLLRCSSKKDQPVKGLR